jgi:hypothetical protein
MCRALTASLAQGDSVMWRKIRETHLNALQSNPKGRQKWIESTLRNRLRQRSHSCQASDTEFGTSADRRNPMQSRPFESEKASEAETVALEKTVDITNAKRRRSIECETFN